MTVQDSYILYSSAVRLMLNWPIELYNFLDRYIQHKDKKEIVGIKKLGTTYETWLKRHWQHSEFDFVKQAFDQYLIEHFPAQQWIVHTKHYKQRKILTKQLPYIPLSEAIEVLGVKKDAIESIVEDGYLNEYPSTVSSKRKGLLLYRDKVKELAQQMRDMLTKTEVSETLKIGFGVIEDLAQLGLLKPVGDVGYFKTMFRRSDIVQLTERLETVVNLRSQQTKTGVTLVQAVSIVNKVGLGAAHLLAHILDNELLAHIASEKISSLDELWFHQEDIKNLVSGIKRERQWLTSEEVRLYLNVGRVTLEHWISKGWLQPVAQFSTATYFDFTSVSQLRERLMTTNQVIALIRTKSSVIHKWVADGNFEAISGPGIDGQREYLFDMNFVLHWHALYLTSAEVKSILDLNVTGFQSLIRQGKLIPMGEPCYYWFSRQSLRNNSDPDG